MSRELVRLDVGLHEDYNRLLELTKDIYGIWCHSEYKEMSWGGHSEHLMEKLGGLLEELGELPE